LLDKPVLSAGLRAIRVRMGGIAPACEDPLHKAMPVGQDNVHLGRGSSGQGRQRGLPGMAAARHRAGRRTGQRTSVVEFRPGEGSAAGQPGEPQQLRHVLRAGIPGCPHGCERIEGAHGRMPSLVESAA
jgi:hypothetical protein